MKLDKNVFKNIDLLNQKIDSLSDQLTSLKAELERKNHVIKTNLSRLSCGDSISSDCIMSEMVYQDLSPEEAFKLYQKENYNFIFLDVSEKSFTSISPIEETIKIELEFLEMRINELNSKSTPIFVISENGTRSILACEILKRYGFININNISGGHKFWPGHRGAGLGLVA